MKKTVLTAVVLQGLVVSMAFAQGGVRSSGDGICSVFANGSATESYENCRIDYDISEDTSTFISDGYYETSFEGDAMEDTQLSQANEPYVRRDEEAGWCYDSPQSTYSICFEPILTTAGDDDDDGNDDG